MPITIVILAAGSSSRMGQSKQLMHVGKDVMLRNTVKTALASRAHDCVVVLGSNAEAHRDAIEDLPAKIVLNPNWDLGMGSSLKEGLRSLMNSDLTAEAILVMLSDQQAITVAHINTIIDTYQHSGSSIVAASYNGNHGVPALFHRSFFEAILALEDAGGAKAILIKNPDAVHLIEIPEAAIDLDTPEDYRRFTAAP